VPMTENNTEKADLSTIKRGSTHTSCQGFASVGDREKRIERNLPKKAKKARGHNLRQALLTYQ
jgi:hypothetical protein